MSEYIGSIDTTYIVIKYSSYRLRQLHIGYEINHTTRICNLTVNHYRKILSTTTRHPAHSNDKILIIFDEFIKVIRDGNYNDKFKFELHDFNENKQEIKVKYHKYY